MEILGQLLSTTMIQNKKKFKNGIRKIAIAIAFLPGPILFVLSSHNNQLTDSINLLFSILGIVSMITCVIFGFLGLRDLLSGFFDPPSE